MEPRVSTINDFDSEGVEQFVLDCSTPSESDFYLEKFPGFRFGFTPGYYPSRLRRFQLKVVADAELELS